MLGSILGIILLGIVIAILISCVKIVKQAQQRRKGDTNIVSNG